MTTLNWIKNDAGEHEAEGFVVRMAGKSRRWVLIVPAEFGGAVIGKPRSLADCKKDAEDFLAARPVADLENGPSPDDLEAGPTVQDVVAYNQEQREAVTDKEIEARPVPEPMPLVEKNDKPKRERKLKGGTTGDPVPAPRKVPTDRSQALLDELFWRHGNNLDQWTSFPQKLVEAGLIPSEVTEVMVEKAKVNATKRAVAQIDAEVDPQAELVWQPPFTRETEVSTQTVWQTACHRLEVVRVIPKLPGDVVPYFAACWCKVARNRQGEERLIRDCLERHFKILTTAMHAAEGVFKSNGGLRSVKSNLESIAEEAERSGLGTLPAADAPSDPAKREGDVMLRISEKAARKLFIDMGIEDSENWSRRRLTENLNDLVRVTKDHARPEDEDSKDLHSRVVAALKDGKEVGLKEAAPTHEGNGKATGKKNKTNPEKKTEDKKDRFGVRMGTRKAQINALLSGKPKTVKEIREEGDIPGSYMEYLEELHAKGVVVGNHENGWSLAKKWRE